MINLGARRTLLGLLASVLVAPAVARDLPRDSPERKEILDTVRWKDTKFIVKDLVSTSGLAYVCAVPAKPKSTLNPTRSDGEVVASEWLLAKTENGIWLNFDLSTTHAGTLAELECTASAQIRKPEDIAPLFRSEVMARMREMANSYSRYPTPMDTDGLGSLYRELHRRGLVEADLVIDQEKSYYGDRLPVLLTYCGDSASCQAAMREWFEDMERIRKSSRINTLVWEHCLGIMRTSLFEPTRKCIDIASSTKACRPGLRFFADSESIEACKRDIYDTCQRVVTAPERRTEACWGFVESREQRPSTKSSSKR